jgi:hypothetical protein
MGTARSGHSRLLAIGWCGAHGEWRIVCCQYWLASCIVPMLVAHRDPPCRHKAAPHLVGQQNGDVDLCNGMRLRALERVDPQLEQVGFLSLSGRGAFYAKPTIDNYSNVFVGVSVTAKGPTTPRSTPPCWSLLKKSRSTLFGCLPCAPKEARSRKRWLPADVSSTMSAASVWRSEAVAT